MQVYVVCYDITDDGIRNRIAKALLAYGERVQYSVFEIAVENADILEKVCKELREISDEDSEIRLYRLCATCRQDSHLLDGQHIAQMPEVLIL
ncbi:CRISPR-associated endonuclease Cas2 [Candidatus Venteria ishoeyi]|uniref:CRISPR-associated endoribonuclease Cas2 n=1 Tax=Candidatus Venteria ishoeyi TaxID=1899563 RepID=A0A1H6F518_9GAMM|nr:CRISPR-associated endonuclease Cas2 [Candidatus Venteria ishoeyi]SEH05248.1 CRISPR-associated endoribonuclease Cas2 [Candidatus Venteria ishoeyi]